MDGEIMVVTGPGEGHLRPCMELCNHLSSRNYQIILVIPSSLSSSILSSFCHKTAAIASTASAAGVMPESDSLHWQSAQDLEAHLENRSHPPVCAVVDFQMGWTKAHFWKFNAPVVGLFTFGQCAAAMEWGAWKAQAEYIRPGETRLIPGLPEETGLTYSNLKKTI